MNTTDNAQQDRAAVYLVATGETFGGRETYTRHDEPVPNADYERLWSTPAAPATGGASSLKDAALRECRAYYVTMFGYPKDTDVIKHHSAARSMIERIDAALAAPATPESAEPVLSICAAGSQRTLVEWLDGARDLPDGDYRLYTRHTPAASDVIAERDRLQAFKDYVHQRLDAAGIPADPPSPHREAGCRIGGRLDIALAASDGGLREASASEIEWLEYAIDHLGDAGFAEDRKCADALQGLRDRLTNPPTEQAKPSERDKEWCMRMSDAEHAAGCDITAGTACGIPDEPAVAPAQVTDAEAKNMLSALNDYEDILRGQPGHKNATKAIVTGNALLAMRLPLPVAVPPKRFPDDGDGDDDARNAGWNACVDQMLAAAPPPPAAAGVVVDGIECHGLDTPERVCFYEQDFYVLSNFSSFRVHVFGVDFDTSEYAYHWAKFAGTAPEVQEKIRAARSAHDAFKIAEQHRSVRRQDWDEIKFSAMREILRVKVAQHEYVSRKLLATGDRLLVENSWRDSVWGWGPNRDGQNMLGKLWMEVRTELRAALAGQQKGVGR